MPKADIEMGYEDDRLVLITIRPATDDDNGRLDYEELVYAARQIQDFARTEYRTPIGLRAPFGSKAVGEMVNTYNKGGGKITDEYLARLALAYEELAPRRRDVSTALADALGKPVPTVKGHLMRARKEKHFLTEAIDGKEGGEATDAAREVVGMLPKT